MTTRSKQKISSILAGVSIIALLLLLVFLWSAVRNGVFSNSNEFDAAYRSYRLQPINLSDSTNVGNGTPPPLPTTVTFDASTGTTESSLPTTIEHSKHHSHGHHSHHQHHHHHETTASTHGKPFSFLVFFVFFFRTNLSFTSEIIYASPMMSFSFKI